MGGGFPQTEGAGTRGDKNGFEAGGHNGRVGQLGAGHGGRGDQ